MNRSLRGGHFVSQCVSVSVVEDRTGSQQTLQESVALRVRTKWRKIEGAHRHSNLFQDSLPRDMYKRLRKPLRRQGMQQTLIGMTSHPAATLAAKT